MAGGSLHRNINTRHTLLRAEGAGADARASKAAAAARAAAATAAAAASCKQALAQRRPREDVVQGLWPVTSALCDLIMSMTSCTAKPFLTGQSPWSIAVFHSADAVWMPCVGMMMGRVKGKQAGRAAGQRRQCPLDTCV